VGGLSKVSDRAERLIEFQTDPKKYKIGRRETKKAKLESTATNVAKKQGPKKVTSKERDRGEEEKATTAK
jgi:hypothetical protein